MVEEVKLNDQSHRDGYTDPVEADKASAFKQLAGFLGEKNSKSEKLSMTTPVFNKTKQGVMQFTLGKATR